MSFKLFRGVKVGVTTKIKLYHKSIGETDKKWLKNKLFFEYCMKNISVKLSVDRIKIYF